MDDSKLSGRKHLAPSDISAPYKIFEDHRILHLSMSPTLQFPQSDLVSQPLPCYAPSLNLPRDLLLTLSTSEHQFDFPPEVAAHHPPLFDLLTARQTARAHPLSRQKIYGAHRILSQLLALLSVKLLLADSNRYLYKPLNAPTLPLHNVEKVVSEEALQSRQTTRAAVTRQRRQFQVSNPFALRFGRTMKDLDLARDQRGTATIGVRTSVRLLRLRNHPGTTQFARMARSLSLIWFLHLLSS